MFSSLVFYPVESITLQDTTFTVKHTLRKNMKRLIVRVEKPYEIKISSSRTSQKNVIGFLRDQQSWILEQHLRHLDRYCKGNILFYLDKAFTIEHKKGRLDLSYPHIYIDPEKAQRQIKQFYKDKANQHIRTRIKYWEALMNVECQALTFRYTKRSWGSCNSKGRINFNPMLMRLSHEMIDYIIVHELAHLQHMNHSKAFYSLVKLYIPDYLSIKQKIDEISIETFI